jgi:GntR family transcriptional regulator
MPDIFPYRRIADELREAIHRQEFAEGDRLPSENRLAAKYDTTRATVRKAFALLRADGLVLSEQGKGVFVRPRPTVHMVGTGRTYSERRKTGITNFNAEASAHGLSAEQEIIAVERVPAAGDIATRLAVPEGTPLLVRRRLFMVDGHPMQLVDGYYEYQFAKGTALARKARIKGGAHAEIERPKIGRRLTRFVEELELRMPLPSEVEALAVLPGVPVARVLRTAYDDDDQPIEVLESIVPGDRHRFLYEITLPS